MKFFRQTTPNTCNIIAIQHILSHFNQHPSFQEIKKSLPRHSFGSTMLELETYLNKRGIKTKLKKTLIEKEIKNKPIIVNVDVFKIRKQKGKPVPHYIIIIKEKDQIYMYDGANFKRRVKRNFEGIYKASLDTNKFHENGMWLITK